MSTKKESSAGTSISATQIIVPLLVWNGNSSNFPEWFKAYCADMEAVYKKDGTYARKDKYYEHPMPEMMPLKDELTASADADEATKADIKAENLKIKVNNRRMEVINEHRLKGWSDSALGSVLVRSDMFSRGWNTISEVSRDRLRQHHIDFKYDVEEAEDPLLLVRAARVTHSSSKSGTPSVDKVNASKALVNVKQKENETTHEYRDRVMRLAELNDTEGGPKFTDDLLAAVFILGLDERFTQFKVETMNNSSSGRQAYPANLDLAYTLASQYKVVVTTKAGKEFGVFAMSQQTSKKPASHEKRSSNKNKGSTKSEEKFEKSKTQG